MKAISRDLVLTELKVMREDMMYNTYQYQAIVKAIEKVESLPIIELDKDADDLK